MRLIFSRQLVVVSVVLLVLSIGTFITIREMSPMKTTTPLVVEEKKIPQSIHKVIGTSVEGRSIESFSYGTGDTHILFVGGIHGGYEWNSVMLAYKYIDYLNLHQETVPKNLTIDIIPSLNPDGVFRVTGKDGRFSVTDVSTDTNILKSGRFNADDVDLNRNFDCKWKPKSTWQTRIVNAGTAPFSEPEAKTLRDFISNNHPSAVIFWHSKSNGVYASQCENGILKETLNIMNTYANASGYKAIETFDAYETTGAAEDWLASVNIPAITVELETHETVEWEKNLLGINAIIDYYKK